MQRDTERELERLFALKAAKGTDELATEIGEEERRKVGDLNSRGLRQSGEMVWILIGLDVKMLMGRARIRYEAFNQV